MTNWWQFAMRGIDLTEKLLIGQGGWQFAIMEVDYFTKWVEAKPITMVTTTKIMSFVTQTLQQKRLLMRKINAIVAYNSVLINAIYQRAIIGLEQFMTLIKNAIKRLHTIAFS